MKQHAFRAVALPRAPDLIEALSRVRGDVCLLESSAGSAELARYSYLCVEPQFVLHAKRDEVRFGAVEDGRARDGRTGNRPAGDGDFFSALSAVLEDLATLDLGARASEWPPFVGGLVGALGYELLHALESVPDLGRDDLALPDAALFVPGAIIAVDHLSGAGWIFAHAFGDDAAPELERRVERVQHLLEGVGPSVRPEVVPSQRGPITEGDLVAAGFQPQLSREAYLSLVRTAREEIFAGNVFEICTTTRFDTRFAGEGLALHRSLRKLHPAPFSAYFRFADAELLCASPERFMKLDADWWAETRPIKGTRPRGRTPTEDAVLREALATSEKDRAENVMIVDLARNDLGRVCELGSVTVPKLFEIESHPFTHQLVSTVRGRLRPELGPVDLVRAAFPGGSMTGAPKIEAMRIIERLEPVDRGIYSGSLGWFDVSGAMDLNIVIRSFLKKADRLSFHVGGAVVADSVPEDEYQEVLDKAHGLLAAFLDAGGGS